MCLGGRVAAGSIAPFDELLNKKQIAWDALHLTGREKSEAMEWKELR
jgi:hypothetical protein